MSTFLATKRSSASQASATWGLDSLNSLNSWRIFAACCAALAFASACGGSPTPPRPVVQAAADIGDQAPAVAAPAAAQSAVADTAAILAGSQLPAVQPAPLAEDGLGVTVHRLSNGLSVYISTDRQVPRFSAWIAVRAGSRHDPADSTGLAHYLEHMLFKGSDEFGTLDAEAERVHIEQIAALYDALRQTEDEGERAQIFASIDAETQKAARYAIPNELDQLYARLGINGLNAFTSNEQTVYIADVPKNRLDAWARMEAERFRDPVFRLFYPELEAVYEEKNISLDRPFSQVFETMFAALFAGHPYGTQPTIGLVEHLKTPAYADMVAYFQRWYVPNNMAIVLAGDIDAQTALPVLETYFADWQPKALEPPTPAAIVPVKGRQQRDIVTKGESGVYLAWQTVPVGHEDEDAIEVMSWLMDNSSAGLVELELVLPQILPQAGVFADFRNEAGYFAMYGTARSGQELTEVEAHLVGVIGKLKRGEFRQDDLDAVVLQARMREMRELESRRARVSKITNAYIHHVPWERAAQRSARLGKVTKQDVMRVAERYLGADFVAVHRRQGKTSPPKIPKPKITPVPLDPGRKSAFAAAVEQMPVAAIEADWLTEGEDFVRAQMPAGELLAVPNRVNELFGLSYRFDFGYRQVPLMCFALQLLEQSGIAQARGRAGAAASSAPALSGSSDLADLSDPAALKQALFAMGTSISFSCDSDRVSISVSGIDGNLEASVELLGRWLARPALREDIRKKLAANTISQRKDGMDDPTRVASALAQYAFYGRDSAFLALPSNRALERARIASLNRLLTQLSTYRHRTSYMGPRSATEVAEVAALGPARARAYRSAPKRKSVRYRKVRGQRVYMLAKEVAQSRIHLAIPGAPLPAADDPMSGLYTEYMGGGMGALVFQEIREARGLAYSAWAGHRGGLWREDDSAVLGFIGTQSDKTNEALVTLLGLLRDFPMQPARLAMAKQSLDEQYRTERIEPRSRAGWLQRWQDQGYTNDPRAAMYAAILSADEAGLAAFAERIAGGGLIVAIMGDPARIDLGQLGEIAPIERVALKRIFSY